MADNAQNTPASTPAPKPAPKRKTAAPAKPKASAAKADADAKVGKPHEAAAGASAKAVDASAQSNSTAAVTVNNSTPWGVIVGTIIGVLLLLALGAGGMLYAQKAGWFNPVMVDTCGNTCGERSEPAAVIQGGSDVRIIDASVQGQTEVAGRSCVEVQANHTGEVQLFPVSRPGNYSAPLVSINETATDGLVRARLCEQSTTVAQLTEMAVCFKIAMTVGNETRHRRQCAPLAVADIERLVGGETLRFDFNF